MVDRIIPDAVTFVVSHLSIQQQQQHRYRCFTRYRYYRTSSKVYIVMCIYIYYIYTVRYVDPIPLDCSLNAWKTERGDGSGWLCCSFIINEDDDNSIGETVSFILFTPF